jgi:tRNA threonylcarbamoyladenosine biosynthesis protein TsaB
MLLAIDTSTKSVGLALYDGTRVVGETLWRSEGYHTVELAPALRDLLNLCHTEPEKLKVLGVALGPGSFTGLRIGLALAKGMAQALNLPIIGIPTLDFLAYAQPPLPLPMAAVLQAGRKRLAVQWYSVKEDSWEPGGEISVLTADELSAKIKQPTLICGELDRDGRQILARKYKNAILATPAQSVRQPGFLAELAWKRWQNKQFDDIASLSPIYLHYGEEIEEPE